MGTYLYMYNHYSLCPYKAANIYGRHIYRQVNQKYGR